MQFIAYTALIDAVLALIALLIVSSRRKSMTNSVRAVSYFSKYLVFTFIFLLFISGTILLFTDKTQAMAFFVTDLVLWVALSYMLAFAYEGKSVRSRNNAIILLVIVGLLRSLYQLSGILGWSIALPSNVVYVVSNLDAWLMYVVWVPVSIYFLLVGLQTSDATVRMRSFMFGIGLLLITFTWAFRLLSGNPSYAIVSGASVVGFALLLYGVIYNRSKSAAVAY